MVRKIDAIPAERAQRFQAALSIALMLGIWAQHRHDKKVDETKIALREFGSKHSPEEE